MTSNMAHAHPHATSVAVYPALSLEILETLGTILSSLDFYSIVKIQTITVSLSIEMLKSSDQRQTT